MLTAGEVISPDVGPDILLASVERWSRRSGPGGLSLKQVTDESTADHWRIRRDGLVWLGVETYPAVLPTFDYTEITRDPAQDSITIAPEDDQPLPAVGDSFLDRNIVGIVTTIGVGSMRQVITWESATGAGGDRLLGPLGTLVNAFVGRQIDYAKMYPCVVNFQDPITGTLDLTPDDETVRGNGFKRIQISYGLPGVTATVPTPGGRVNLYFQNGDPKQPRAALWEGSGVTLITVGASGPAKVVARDGDSVNMNAAMILWMGQVEVAINLLASGSVTPLSTTFTGIGDVVGTSTKMKTE